MLLDFIDNLNEHGENLVRLYDFGMAEAIKFQNALKEFVAGDEETFDISTLDFIEERNCKLIMAISDTDLGVVTRDKELFYCALTFKGFKELIQAIEPYTKREVSGYKMLYDIDSVTDLLFSPKGSW